MCGCWRLYFVFIVSWTHHAHLFLVECIFVSVEYCVLYYPCVPAGGVVVVLEPFVSCPPTQLCPQLPPLVPLSPPCIPSLCIHPPLSIRSPHSLHQHSLQDQKSPLLPPGITSAHPPRLTKIMARTDPSRPTTKAWTRALLMALLGLICLSNALVQGQSMSANGNTGSFISVVVASTYC